jgi:hypothetical protein
MVSGNDIVDNLFVLAMVKITLLTITLSNL